jgi:hypothetical protein
MNNHLSISAVTHALAILAASACALHAATPALAAAAATIA